VAGFLEREGLLVRDDDNDYLALDGLEDDPMLQIHGYSITYRIATGKQQGRKVFTLQSIAPIEEQGSLPTQKCPTAVAAILICVLTSGRSLNNIHGDRKLSNQ
jgi:hypothetical protein